MKKKPTKIVELVIEENNEMLAIDAISLVSAPAIEGKESGRSLRQVLRC